MHTPALNAKAHNINANGETIEARMQSAPNLTAIDPN
jgi:hypothetical protein